ncbi:MAG: hypothetical protein H7Y12_08445 [Sphingobacteriaceae bacterium]|nr:hypothetical protein [Cytophagaceae bacterium]
MADQLPIYRLSVDDADPARLMDIGHRLFGLNDGFKLGEANDHRTLTTGKHVVEIAPASGGLWAADETQLWKPAVRADLPKEAEAVRLAEAFHRERKLLPTLEKPFRYGKPVMGGTHFALRQEGRREDRQLDVQVVHPILVNDVPLVGGGSDFTLTLGHKSAPIGFSGVWRPVRESFPAQLIPRKRADEQFREMTKNLKLESFDATLAYYAAPSFQKQEFLYPVYVYRGMAVFGDQRVPLRQIMLPATDFGPAVRFPKPQPQRPKLLKPPVQGSEKRKEQIRRSMATRAPTRPWEAGTSWIGESGGLAGSHDNAQGFVNEWASAGWHIDFNWGDANAFESDWRRNDDQWVDNADFVFYTGHASMNGWVLANPDDGFLNFSEVGSSPGTPGDLWGQSDLEWAVIAACGPLQDSILAAGGGDVLARWDGAFDGMHILMGYGGVTFDNTDEGRKLSQYAKSGNTLINSWFRTAKEIQPSTNGVPAPDGPNVYVGAMWVGKSGVDPFNDHAWDFGSVSNDPRSPTWQAAMWTLC